MIHDVIIAGGGVAGLSAALVLGRCRRSVLVIDDNNPRNAVTHGLHGFLTRDGIDPMEFRRTGREQLAEYRLVEMRTGTVTDARSVDSGFEVTINEDQKARSRKMLIATGLIDDLPPIPNIGEFYGRTVFHCPYCDGWEMRDRPLAVYGHGSEGEQFALELKTWSDDIVLCTDGHADLSQENYAHLFKHGITLREEKIIRLVGEDGVMEGIEFAGGEVLPRRGMFFYPGQRQRSPLAQKFGCHEKGGTVDTGKFQVTHVPGLYLAGDASRSVQLAIIAAAQGAEAAFAINIELQKEQMGACQQ